MTTLFSFIVVLGLLIFVHEFGHFLMAKLFRVRVLKFSLGFGPTLFGTRYGETEYVVSAIPLGGYVKMFGESPAAGDEVAVADAPYSFSMKPVWQRFLIVAGGPVFNLLFAAFLFSLIFGIHGIPEPVDTTRIGAVGQDTPAARAGLEAGDVIVALDHEPVASWEDLSQRIMDSHGQPMLFTLLRGEERIEVSLEPAMSPIKDIFGAKVGERYMVGISRAEEVVYNKVSLGSALLAGVEQTWSWIYLTVVGIVKIIQKVVPASELGGPILIAQMAGKQLEAGWTNFLYFMAVISVNLGILNLLPIPILDGGHLVFFSVEAIMRRPVSLRTMEIFQQIGMVLLGTLMIFAFYNDLARLFQ
ncbi:MAG: RIP metalloprotease RseP [Desulfobacterales bacterium]|nr:RIP metalloprotease RseP [Desulfobacterales bacterium]